MTLRPYKFLIVPVVQRLDEDGVVTGELQPEQPDVAFGVQGLLEYANGFEQALAKAEPVNENQKEEQNGNRREEAVPLSRPPAARVRRA